MPAAPAARSSLPRIGVFDSGLGGLSVLRAIHALLPQADLLYVADSGHAPYGERAPEYVRARSEHVTRWLLSQGAQMVVVACNTATAVAIDDLRQRWPDCPFVGVEPGVKPAAALTRNGHIGVLATEGTLRSDRFRWLAQAHAAHVHLHLQPCPGLAAAIEAGDLADPALAQRVAQCCAPLRQAGVDTVVLGCTHYPFVAHIIARCMGPQVQLVDTAEAVARRTAALLATSDCTAPPDAPAPTPAPRLAQVDLRTTGDLAVLERVARHWLSLDARLQVRLLAPCSGSVTAR